MDRENLSYTEQQQPSPFTCKGCFFNREIVRKKVVKEQSRRTKIVEEHTGKYGCYAPKGEPYDSCIERGVIFT